MSVHMFKVGTKAKDKVSQCGEPGDVSAEVVHVDCPGCLFEALRIIRTTEGQLLTQLAVLALGVERVVAMSKGGG